MQMWICKHCNLSFTNFTNSEKANHSRWCDLNPRRSQYTEKLKNARSAITNFKNQYSYGATCSEETREKISRSGQGRKHSEVTKSIIKEKALNSTHRRLRRKMIEYKGVWLDSTWELELAKRLDEKNIRWVRPEPIRWVDNAGVSHNYFPDFYLPDHNLFLDPKNPMAVSVQQEKLTCLLQQHTNIVILTSLEDCKNFNID